MQFTSQRHTQQHQQDNRKCAVDGSIAVLLLPYGMQLLLQCLLVTHLNMLFL